MFVAVYKSGGHQYCRLSETYRDENGKVKTKVIKNFGRVDLLLKNDPKALDKLKAQYGGSGQDKIERRSQVLKTRCPSFGSFTSAMLAFYLVRRYYKIRSDVPPQKWR